MSSQTTKPCLILHGGAGNVTRDNLPPDRYALFDTALRSIYRSTSKLLDQGVSALDAATHAVMLFEDCELFNCGKGAVFTRDGTIELEASVMVTRSYHKRACGVVLLKHVKHPILLAREMLIHGETDGSGGDNGGNGDPSGGPGGAQGHCCLGGPTVEKLAKEWGLEMVDQDYFWTKKRWEEHLRGLKGEVEQGGYLSQGTVGCVALDEQGVMCVATSTGGLTNKLSGRIGDTPTIGAGFWAEEWDESPIESERRARRPQEGALSGLSTFTDGLRSVLGDCIPSLSGYESIPPFPSTISEKSTKIRALAMSGTGNGDSFLRLAAVRTAGAIVRFSPDRSLASAVNQIVGPGGEMQRSAGDRWGNGEGSGGIIGIELVNGKGKVVFDFNCGGMFRCWVDEVGKERVMVFRDEY
ncbi:hypothetical protein N7G274_002681 [Stereocaulon virgatum]|uniref:N-terminal nucleophile aminohydrolase n=1 Tax=Stereocaulon virgatum TaxID=373712 RepID=A0ABR4AHA7_9LECA